jgi:AcrR family transcriptional regulator
MPDEFEIQPLPDNIRRKKRRIEERREQILVSAAHVFGERGYQRATTREIAEVADISEGLIYSYFESKDHILLAILEKLANSAFEETNPVGEDLVQNANILIKSLQIRHRFLDENESMMRATLGEAINNPHFREHYFEVLMNPAIKSMESELQTWIANDDIPDTDISIASRFLLAELIGLFFLRAVGDPVVIKHWQDKKFLKKISDYFLSGLKPLGKETRGR